MRILAIRGERLASLHDRFEIDFAAAPLAGAGLFAITGPTGAGKSTILDAICLALYGDTPRIEGRGGPAVSLGLAEQDDEKLAAKDARHLLTRGSKHGFAEVDFRGKDGLDYRARWWVPTRPRAAGVADADMSVVRLADQQVLATGPRDARKEIVRLLGFTFAEFQKAVMLPQGQFAEFLRADAKARADILEKVAGGEIYAALGRLAGERQAAERKALDDLEAEAAGHRPLSDEDREAATAAKAEADEALRDAQARALAAREAATWHATLARLAKDVEGAEGSRTEAVRQEAEAAGRRAELAEVERALGRRAALAEATGAEEALRLAADALRDRRAEAQAAGAAAREAEAKVAGAGQVRAAVAAEVARAKPELEEARRLDVQLQQARTEAADAVRSAGRAAEAAREAERLGREAAEACHRHEAARAEAARWLEARAAEAPVVSDWARCQELLARRAAALGEAAAARQRRDAAATPEAVEAARAAARAAEVRRDEAEAAAGTARREQERAAQGLAEAEQRRELTTAALQRARDAQGLAPRRAELKDGEACPLCGATEHPWAGKAEVDALVAAAAAAAAGCEVALRAAKEEAARQAAAVSRVEQAAVAARTDAEGRAREAAKLAEELGRAGRAAAEAELARAEGAAQACEAALAGPFAGVAGWREALRDDAEALAADWAQRVAAHRAREEARAAAVKALAMAEPEQARAAAVAAEKTEAARLAHERQAAAAAALKGLEARRAGLLGGRGATEVEQGLERRLADAAGELDRLVAEAGKAAADLAGAGARLGGAEQQHAAAARRSEAAAGALATALAELGIARAALEARVKKGDAFVAGERKALDALAAAVRDAATRVEERQRAVQAHEATRPALGAAEAGEAQRAAEAGVAVADERRLAAATALEADARARKALAELGPRLEAQRARHELAAQLGELIGAGGAKSFRTFAQGLALDVLLGHANRHLEQLAPRYRLTRVPGTDMDLQVLDQDLGGAPRGVNSLSGGETFLVSLGLALGLSGLATKAVRVESLFVDEGFGTLDPDALDQAMAVLEGLRATGRTVGIISHVPELHERIGVLVQVEKLGAGRSRVRAVRLEGGAG